MNKYMSSFDDVQKKNVFAILTDKRNKGVKAILKKRMEPMLFEDLVVGGPEWIEGCIEFDSNESRWRTDRDRFAMLGYLLLDGEFTPNDDLDDAAAWCEAAEAAYADWGDKLMGRECDGVDRDPRHWRMILNAAMSDPAPVVAPDGGSTQVLDFRNSIVKETTDREGKTIYVVESGANPFTPIVVSNNWPGPISL